MDGSRHAIPLEQVRRLEAISASEVEFRNGTGLSNYRGTILHMVDPVALLTNRLNMAGPVGFETLAGEEKSIHVVVCREDEQPIGLMFAGVVDIVREHVKATGKPRLAGSECSAIVGGHLTDILDVPTVMQLADQHFNRLGAMMAGDAR